jgi:hypothetical protein
MTEYYRSSGWKGIAQGALYAGKTFGREAHQCAEAFDPEQKMA